MSAIALVEELLVSAHTRGASDVHFNPQGGKLVVRARIDGGLQDLREIPIRIHAELLSRIKVLAGLRTDEHQAAQDGRFKLALPDASEVDIRVSIAPTYYGENAVLRLLTRPAGANGLHDLGLAPVHKKLIESALLRPHGMILVTGPTGSGKTSTLYALLSLLNRGEANIVTIEDPVEYSIAGINQIPVNTRTGLTFETGLRSILRQDPDIIMVGEIRDTETAQLAIQAALTGHLIFSTLHTNDAPTALPRLLDLKVEPYLLASTVSLIIAQRLVRMICRECRHEQPLTSAERSGIHAALPGCVLPKSAVSYFGTGCEVCAGTGFRGRIGTFEVLGISPEVRNAIADKAPLDDLRELAHLSGMHPLMHDALEKALAGVTTVGEALRLHHE